MTRLPKNSIGPLALLNVYAAGTDTVTGSQWNVSASICTTWRISLCTENEIYHFDNVFFKIGEDDARLMSPSQRVLLETEYEVLQRAELIRGSTTAKGLYANSFFVLIHYTFGGVRAQALSVFVLSTSTSGSSRRVPPPRGSRLAPLLQGLPFSVFLFFVFGTRLLLIPADPFGIHPPFVIKYVFVVVLSYTREGRQPGRPDVFPGRGCVRLQVPFPVAQSVHAGVLRVLRVLGRPDVSSRPRLCTSLRGGSWVSNVSRSEMFEGIVGSTFLGWVQHGLRCLLFGRLFKALRIPIPVLRTTPSIAWLSTVFGVAGLVIHFEARRWIGGCMRTGL